jgi:hypothetical protein
VQETIRDEGQEWSYSLSANLIRDRIKWLIVSATRRSSELSPMPSAFISFLHERDR